MKLVNSLQMRDEEVRRVDTPFEFIDPSMFSQHFKARDSSSHKGMFGHVAIFAGSRGHLGAGYLACLAALRAGAGLVTYCLPERVFAKFDARYPEVMCDAIPDNETAAFHPLGLQMAFAIAEKKTVVVIGPAIGTEKETREFVNALVGKLNLPVVIDADGLNVLDLSVVRGRRATTILTPHPGEMARLCRVTTDVVQKDRAQMALKLARDANAVIILKGKGTIVALPDGRAAINPTGNAGMATAGMGDVLTGIIAAFLGQGMDVMSACCAAVYIHGLAGDMVAAQYGERALIASDVIGKLGEAMRVVEL